MVELNFTLSTDRNKIGYVGPNKELCLAGAAVRQGNLTIRRKVREAVALLYVLNSTGSKDHNK